MSEEPARLVRINHKGAVAYGAMHFEGREAEVIYTGNTLTKVRVEREPGSSGSVWKGRDRVMFFNSDEIEEIA